MALKKFNADQRLPPATSQADQDFKYALYDIFRDIRQLFGDVDTTITNAGSTIQIQDDGVNVGTAGQYTTYNFADNITATQTSSTTVEISATGGTAENEFWERMAASLDPDAYVWVEGANFSETVPVGETWYIVNAWQTEYTGVGGFMMRHPRTEFPLALSEGSTIKGNSTDGASVYYFNPALVTSKPAYANARQLYYDRLKHLNALLTYQAQANVSGTTGTAGIVTNDLPGDFEDGIIIGATVYDASWVILASATDPDAGVNLDNEVSDNHQWRVGNSLLLPFKRSVHDAIRARPASVDGTTGVAALTGYGSFLYKKLEAVNWDTIADYDPPAEYSLGLYKSLDRGTITHNAVFNLTTAGTVELWAKRFTQTVNFPVLLCKGTINTAYLLVYNNFGGTDRVFARIFTGGGEITATDTTGWSANTWTHWAMTWDSTDLKLYRDGSLVATQSAGACLTDTGDLRIGDANSAGSNQFIGCIDEVRVWNVARSATDINNNKSVDISAGTSGLVAYYKFNAGTGLTAVDAVAARNATLTNQQQWSPDIPF